ncbi:MAG: HEAT repeat domain-containing protein [Lachnospiraceae bacterium]|nr:HEAT repeat domain-containing protein [Lachnospiraceae bacterium]
MGKIDKVAKLVEKGKTDKLIALAQDKDKEVRLAAIEGLGQVPQTEDSQNVLIRMEEDPDPEIRKAIIKTLGLSGDSYVITHLRLSLSHEKDESVVAAIREALAKIEERIGDE